ncbi:microspherule protein 1 [Pelomyxa schiedti]|nr:microspherule protein 1 [Pelomyxa schiedti]
MTSAGPYLQQATGTGGGSSAATNVPQFPPSMQPPTPTSSSGAAQPPSSAVGVSLNLGGLTATVGLTPQQFLTTSSPAVSPPPPPVSTICCSTSTTSSSSLQSPALATGAASVVQYGAEPAVSQMLGQRSTFQTVGVDAGRMYKFLEEEDAKIEQLTSESLFPAERSTYQPTILNYRKEEKEQQRLILLTEREIEKDRDRDPKVLATLRGRVLRYCMRSKEIVIGRATKMNPDLVDVNLAEEAPASKVSRKHAIIKLKYDGEFYIYNIGRHAIYINGKTLAPNAAHRLVDCCLVEIGNVKFIFDINKALLPKIRRLLAH